MYNIETLLKLMIESKANDLFISLGSYPVLKIGSDIVRLKEEKVSIEMLHDFRKSFLTSEQEQIFLKEKELDFAYSFPGVGRFRVNYFLQRGSDAMVVHHIPTAIKTPDELGLPQILSKIVLEDRGLVLIVGSAGSGKSTTLAALIDHRNQNKTGHILTLEDPIEFLHQHKKSIVNQREIGQDSFSFERALKSALRENPSALLMGEIRDMETIATAVNFAETGHLVLSTMHATNTQLAVERIFNIYGPDLQKTARDQLSENINAIIAQRLVPTKEKKLIPAVEILLPSSRVKDLIKKGEIHLLPRALEFSRAEGMQTFDQCLLQLYKDGIITPETAINFSDHKTDITMKIKAEGWNKTNHAIQLDIEEL
ncbi:PilT/PilU family type 4a pilus ATPase [bacterium]|nr:PilT/PilU family type 4a pilus ATPase [bacterium]